MRVGRGGRSVALIVFVSATTGCHQSAGAPASAAEAAAASRPGPAEIVVGAEMLGSIKVEAVSARELPRLLTVAGKVQFDEDRLARVLAPLSGQVVNLRVKVGDPVRKGQMLCAIASREAAAAAGEHTEAHKDLDFAEKTAAMTQDLFDHQAASKIALQQAQNDLAKARSRVARIDEALGLLGVRDEREAAVFTGRVPVVSTITGTVIERRITDGQFVQTDGTPMATIADMSVVWVLGDVFERDLSRVVSGEKVRVSTSAYPAERFEGHVSYVSPVIDPTTRTAKVRVAVPNPGNRLKPEMFASVVMNVAESERVLTVPAGAVFTEDGRTYVYAAAAPAHFARRQITLGEDRGADREVLTGLRAGDRIVTDGALLLRLEEEKRGS